MNAKILLVIPPQRRSGLLDVLKDKDLQIFLAADFRDAQQKLAESSYDLLLTTAELPDGSWEDVLQLLLESREPCEMLVCSR